MTDAILIDVLISYEEVSNDPYVTIRAKAHVMIMRADGFRQYVMTSPGIGGLDRATLTVERADEIYAQDAAKLRADIEAFQTAPVDIKLEAPRRNANSPTKERS